jgi:glycine/D-amino acid oxidase-like deaminating enzyme
MRDITVIGAGIIGASIAWHLTVSGAKVRLVAPLAGGVATPTSFAWINASWGNPEPYFRLRTRSMREWQRLAAEVPDLSVSWCGGLCWDLPRDDLLVYARDHAAWGYGIRTVTADEASRIEPGVRAGLLPDVAVHVAEEGAAEPVAATLALIADARRRGAEIVDAEVTALREKNGRIVGSKTSAGDIDCDSVVLAAGAGTAVLAASVGITVPVETPPGLIVHSKPVAKRLNGLVLATELHVRQTAEGRIIAGSDFGGTDPGVDPEGAARDLFDKVKAFLNDGDQLEIDFHTVGYRPTPKDGFPVVGGVPGLEGLYLAVTHSGITLAPAIGRFAADEILAGKDEPLLAPYRLSRFSV